MAKTFFFKFCSFYKRLCKMRQKYFHFWKIQIIYHLLMVFNFFTAQKVKISEYICWKSEITSVKEANFWNKSWNRQSRISKVAQNCANQFWQKKIFLGNIILLKSFQIFFGVSTTSFDKITVIFSVLAKTLS